MTRRETGRTAQSKAWRGFPLVFLVALVVGGSAVLAFGRVPAAARCRPPPHPDALLVECTGLGDYEHAAYAFGLEPAALAALGRAQVLVVGNSRAQFAFSTPAFTGHFAAAGIPLYLAGFGYGEGSPFARDVLARAGARPRALVVNADPFFTPERSAPARAIRDEAARTWIGALRVKFAFAVRAAACRWRAPATPCGGRRGAIYRSGADGSWAWQGSYRPGRPAADVDGTTGTPLPPPDPDTLARARDFLAALGLRPPCVFLTAVPNGLVRADGAARALADALGARLVLPAAEGLRTLDGSHLDAESAERWSRAFLDAAGPQIAACAAPSGAPGADRS